MAANKIIMTSPQIRTRMIGCWNCRDRPFDHDHDDPPKWHVDIANGHQICGAVGHGIPLVILAATR